MKTITLKDFGLGTYEKGTSPFPIGDLSLELTNFPHYKGEYRYIAYMNAGKIVNRTVSADDNTVEIEQKLLRAGTLKSRVELWVNGELAKTLKIEDLIIKDENGTLTADPQLNAMAVRLANVESKAATLETDVKTVKESVVTVEKDCADVDGVLRGMLVAMVKFAYEAYNAVPYLNGGTFTKFAKEYGIDTTVLTADEIALITGATEDEQ